MHRNVICIAYFATALFERSAALHRNVICIAYLSAALFERSTAVPGMALRALKARLGCARLLLADVDAASRRFISQLQAAAVQELFHRAASELDLDAKASLMEDVQQCQFEASDSAVLMSTIAGSVELSKFRRLPQDFFARSLIS